MHLMHAPLWPVTDLLRKGLVNVVVDAVDCEHVVFGLEERQSDQRRVRVCHILHHLDLLHLQQSINT